MKILKKDLRDRRVCPHDLKVASKGYSRNNIRRTSCSFKSIRLDFHTKNDEWTWIWSFDTFAGRYDDNVLKYDNVNEILKNEKHINTQLARVEDTVNFQNLVIHDHEK